MRPLPKGELNDPDDSDPLAGVTHSAVGKQEMEGLSLKYTAKPWECFESFYNPTLGTSCYPINTSFHLIWFSS